jgi:superfamily II DNA or RNA helicase
MAELFVELIDEVYMRVTPDDQTVAQEISDHFSFMSQGHQFSPAFKKRKWDGRKRLYTPGRKLLYRGLLTQLVNFASDNGHKVTLVKSPRPDYGANWTDAEIDEWFVEKAFKHEPRDYQRDAFKDAMNVNRGLFLLPTASGKSLCIYSIAEALHDTLKLATLIVVPTIGLVTQMKSDFSEYSHGKSEADVQMIMGGEARTFSKRIVVGTWQSLVMMDAADFAHFGCIIVDEVHKAKAESLIWLMENCTRHMTHRYGFTGTLDDVKLHKMTLEGMFNTPTRFVDTATLMERGQISKLKIKCLTLKHDRKDFVSKFGAKPAYLDELAYIIEKVKRNRLILNLCSTLDGNTLILYQYVDRHGIPLYEMAKKMFPDKTIHFVSQKTKAKDREAIRQTVNASDGHIIIASYGTFSTGMSLNRLSNCIFASSFKSKILTLQSIGRILRLHEMKDYATLWDISDDLMSSRMKQPNHSLRHRNERIKQYASEGFDYEILSFVLDEKDEGTGTV